MWREVETCQSGPEEQVKFKTMYFSTGDKNSSETWQFDCKIKTSHELQQIERNRNDSQEHGGEGQEIFSKKWFKEQD